MGTQFTSRLKQTDRKRIYAGIVDALQEQLPYPAVQTGRTPGAEPKEPATAQLARRKKAAAGTGIGGKKTSVVQTVKSLSNAQRQRFGDAALKEVLNVVADHGFFETFKESALFIDVLKWLLHLRGDAEFNGFADVISEYEMEQSVNPVGVLARKLEELTNEARTDPFRVASASAAKAILVETSLLNVPPKTGDAPARMFGKKLTTLKTRDLVTRYVHRFVYEVLSKPMSMSDPTSTDAVINEARRESGKATERIAKKAVERIVKEGKLNDARRIQQIVVEGLMEYRKSAAA